MTLDSHYETLKTLIRKSARAVREFQDRHTHKFTSWRIQDNSCNCHKSVWWVRECKGCEKLEVDIYK